MPSRIKAIDGLFAEREANDRLRAEDPAAFEAKMRAQLPTSKCCLCGETFKGYCHNAHPVRDEGVRGVRRVQRGDRAAPALPQVGAVSVGAGARPEARSGRLGAPRDGRGGSDAHGSVWPNEPLDRD